MAEDLDTDTFRLVIRLRPLRSGRAVPNRARLNALRHDLVRGWGAIVLSAVPCDRTGRPLQPGDAAETPPAGPGG